MAHPVQINETSKGPFWWGAGEGHIDDSHVDAEKERYLTGELGDAEFEEFIERALILDEDVNVGSDVEPELHRYEFEFSTTPGSETKVLINAYSAKEAKVKAEERRHIAVLAEFKGRVD